MRAGEHMYIHTNRCRDQNAYVLLPNKPNEQDQCNEAQCCYIQDSLESCRRFVCTQRMGMCVCMLISNYCRYVLLLGLVPSETEASDGPMMLLEILQLQAAGILH